MFQAITISRQRTSSTQLLWSLGLLAFLVCPVYAAKLAQPLLLHALTSHYHRMTLGLADAPAGIIVLGGSFERTLEGVRLVQLFPDARLVVTGATNLDYDYARTHVVPSTRVLIEPNARNTYENALFVRALVTPSANTHWLLVTSASHMPRAMTSFEGADFNVEPWPIFDQPSDPELAAGQVRHEILGLIWYRLLGRTRRLWPTA